MAVKEILEDDYRDMGKSILIKHASDDLHAKIERLMRAASFKRGRRVLKTEMTLELLNSHPKIKAL